jgi:hypothetical protein
MLRTDLERANQKFEEITQKAVSVGDDFTGIVFVDRMGSQDSGLSFEAEDQTNPKHAR